MMADINKNIPEEFNSYLDGLEPEPQDNYERWRREDAKEAAARTYCCPERRRLYTKFRYSELHLNYCTDFITCFGTFESEDIEGGGFQMEYCMFCGAKLEVTIPVNP